MTESQSIPSTFLTVLRLSSLDFWAQNKQTVEVFCTDCWNCVFLINALEQNRAGSRWCVSVTACRFAPSALDVAIKLLFKSEKSFALYSIIRRKWLYKCLESYRTPWKCCQRTRYLFWTFILILFQMKRVIVQCVNIVNLWWIEIIITQNRNKTVAFLIQRNFYLYKIKMILNKHILLRRMFLWVWFELVLWW